MKLCMCRGARRESRGTDKSLASSRASREVAAHLHAAQPLADRQEGLLGCEVIHNSHTVSLSEELLADTAISAMGEPPSELCLPWGPPGLAWDLQMQFLTSPDQQCPTAAGPPAHCPQ